MHDYSRYRQNMLDAHLKPRGIHDKKVLKAFEKVPRENFVPEKQKSMAYDDRPLPIAGGQTISQPYIVAFMTQALDLSGDETVLEIGTGSGYAAAILGEISKKVYTVERLEPLAKSTKKILEPYKNVEVIRGDGTLGLPEKAPFDAIVVTAAGPKVPETLKHQLKIGGRMVMPVGEHKMHQTLLRVTRTSEDGFFEEDLAGVAFVPLIGKEGF